MRILSVLVFLLVCSFSFCQNTKWKKPKYIAKISDHSENYEISGALYDITDSSVILTSSTGEKEFLQRFQIPVYYKKIDRIKIQRKFFYRLSKIFFVSAILAGAAGTVMETYLFTVSTENKMDEESLNETKMRLATFTFAAFAQGVIFGFITKNIHKERFIISKSRKQLIENKNRIKKYCYIQ